ncbi:MAG: TldD/PmbA family protein [Anaerolineaceae bacterium]|nr:TldD/PmbA family protein [Anaerolineaceae bacterium]
MKWNREKTLDLLNNLIKMSPADETEVVFQASDYGLTRYAGNVIHQNMSEQDAIVSVRVAEGQKLGSAATNRLDEEGVSNTLKQALEMARMNEINPDFNGFAEKQKLEKVGGETFKPATANTGPQERGDRAVNLLQYVRQAGFEAAGNISNGSYVSAVATSCGQTVYQQETRAQGSVVVNRPGKAGFGTGYAEWHGRDISELGETKIASEAVAISAINKNAVSVDPGEYTVVLTPKAVGLLLYYLSWMSFHSRAVQSGQSFLTNRLGQQVLDEKLSIWDDGLDERNMAIPFDWEGMPKKRVDIITKGCAQGVVYDRFTAAKDQVFSTGHGLSPLRDRYYSSPLPTNLIMATDDKTIQEMIASTKKGIYINSFWYVREVHFGKAVVTGMSRDGTFMIEDGKISKALHNLRFTQSIMEAFRNVDMVGDTHQLTEQFNGFALIPALKLRNFNIVGASPF